MSERGFPAANVQQGDVRKDKCPGGMSVDIVRGCLIIWLAHTHTHTQRERESFDLLTLQTQSLAYVFVAQ